MILRTERLLLREYVPEDWPAVLAYQADARYLRFYPWRERTERDVRAFVDAQVARQHERPRIKFQVAITLPDGTLIGSCGIRQAEPDTLVADMGYELDPRQWGQGYATEAARAILAFG